MRLRGKRRKMTAGRRFNLADEPWVPVAGEARLSLREVFSRREPACLGGNALEKIALLKLLQAVGQAACTPDDEESWRELGPDGLAEACMQYLDRWHGNFWLYGAKPFLQLPSVRRARKFAFSCFYPQIATGVTRCFFQSQRLQPPDDADLALLLLVSLSCCLGSRYVDSKVTLSPCVERRVTALPGPAVGPRGFQHAFLLGRTLRETAWLNLVTRDQLLGDGFFSEGVGTPPWEKMPEGEEDATAKALSRSLMGRLVPMARFLLLADDGVHAVEGIRHPDFRDGMVDPSVTANRCLARPQVRWTDPGRTMWRELPSLLSVLTDGPGSGMRCQQMHWCLGRLRRTALKTMTIWSGGISVHSVKGIQVFRGGDDLSESRICLPVAWLGSGSAALWYASFRAAMKQIETLASLLKKSVLDYFKEAKFTDFSALARRAEAEFWQYVEDESTALCRACESAGRSELDMVLRKVRKTVHACYSRACPSESAGQMILWVKHRPFSGSRAAPDAGGRGRKPGRAERFVSQVLERCAEDRGFAAGLRKGDSPGAEGGAFRLLSSLGAVPGSREQQAAFAFVGASLSRAKTLRDGTLGLGEALRSSRPSEGPFGVNGEGSCHPREHLMRRLVACRSQEDLCQVLRPLLSMLRKGGIQVCHAGLLKDILAFSHEIARKKVLQRWAVEFYDAR